MPSPDRAFNIQSYLHLPNPLEALARDLGGLAKEAANKPAHKTINTLQLVAMGDKLVDPILSLDRDITTFYSQRTEMHRVETTIAQLMRDLHLDPTVTTDTFMVWISPPSSEHNYKKGRIEVGRKVDTTLFIYDVTVDFATDDYLAMAGRLSEFTTDNLTPNHLEQLRRYLFVVSPPYEGFKVLEDCIPLPKVWAAIQNGQADKDKAKAVAWAKIGTNLLSPLIAVAKTEFDSTVVGALLEGFMAFGGMVISNSLCGALNTSLLFSEMHLSLSLDGVVTSSRYDLFSGKFVHRCGQCQTSIYRVISTGFVCQNCHGIYQGC